MRRKVIGKCCDGCGILAFGREHDAGLIDIDKQRDVVVSAAGCGLIDRQLVTDDRPGLARARST